jgi:hypothetical protein
MTKEQIVDVFRNKCLSGFAKKPTQQFAENTENRICISTIIGNITLSNFGIFWHEQLSPFHNVSSRFELTEQEFSDLKDIYFDNLTTESNINKTEDLFRNFIRTKHLTKEWEEYLMQNAGI